MIWRRRRLPQHLEPRLASFTALAPALDRARAVLTESVPGTRLAGRPLAETLLEFEERLREVEAGMDAWRAPEVEEAWLGAAGGLAETLALADRVRTGGAEPEGFEGLIGLIGGLLAPLDVFAAAADRFRALRR